MAALPLADSAGVAVTENLVATVSPQLLGGRFTASRVDDGSVVPRAMWVWPSAMLTGQQDVCAVWISRPCTQGVCVRLWEGEPCVPFPGHPVSGTYGPPQRGGPSSAVTFPKLHGVGSVLPILQMEK